MKLRNLEEYGIKFFNEGIANVTCHKYDTFYNQLHKNKIISNRILLKIDIEENDEREKKRCINVIKTRKDLIKICKKCSLNLISVI